MQKCSQQAVEIEGLRADAECDARLLEIMRKHAAELGMSYSGDQEYLIAVKNEIKRLRADLQRAHDQIHSLMPANQRTAAFKEAAKMARDRCTCVVKGFCVACQIAYDLETKEVRGE